VRKRTDAEAKATRKITVPDEVDLRAHTIRSMSYSKTAKGSRSSTFSFAAKNRFT
jgi:hypothetical protein